MGEDQDNEKNQGKDNFPNEDQKDNKDGVVVAENDEKLDEKEADKQESKTQEEDEPMITEDVDDSKHLPMTENPADEDNEDSSKTEQKHQEFAHTKDKKKENARNALD